MTYTFGPGFWSGIIYIILVAIFMTIFELLFFTLFLGPKETKAANDYLKSMKKPTYDINYVKNAVGSVIVADDVFNKIKNMKLLDSYNVYLNCANGPISVSDVNLFNPSTYVMSSDNSYAILSFNGENELNNALQSINTNATSCKVQMISLYNNESDLFTSFIKNNKITNQAQSILNVSIEREELLMKKINDDAITFICLEVIILLLAIAIFWALLKSSNIKTSPGYDIHWNSFITGITPSLFSALICTSILILFQISMYQFGTKFNYPGNSELKYKVVAKIKADLNL